VFVRRARGRGAKWFCEDCGARFGDDLQPNRSPPPALDADEVLVMRNATSGSKRVYHTRTDCRYVSGGVSTWRRAVAEAWDLKHCKRCRDDPTVCHICHDRFVSGHARRIHEAVVHEDGGAES